MQRNPNKTVLDFDLRTGGTKYSFKVAIDLESTKIGISDHSSKIGETYNLWAPGTPRNDISIQDLLNLHQDKKIQLDAETQTLLSDSLNNKQATLSCRLSDDASINHHLLETAKVLLTEIMNKNYIALQEFLHISAKEKRTLFFNYLRDVNSENHESGKPAFTEAEIDKMIKTLESCYEVKHQHSQTKCGQTILINPKNVEECTRYQSNNDEQRDQYEAPKDLGAHIYLLKLSNHSKEVVASVHSNFLEATNTMKNLLNLVNLGLTVCGDINVHVSDSKHEDARHILEKLKDKSVYNLKTDSTKGSGATYDIVASLDKSSDQYNEKLETLVSMIEEQWTPANGPNQPSELQKYSHFAENQGNTPKTVVVNNTTSKELIFNC